MCYHVFSYMSQYPLCVVRDNQEGQNEEIGDSFLCMFFPMGRQDIERKEGEVQLSLNNGADAMSWLLFTDGCFTLGVHV